MTKALEAFRTIGEVSDELDVPKHVLRFWEGRFPQLKPMKRGGGRRFYRPEDVALLRGIHHLLHKAGYTIKGVQRILREHGIDSVKLDEGATIPRTALAPAASPASPASPVTAAASDKAKRGAPAKRVSVIAAIPLTRDQRAILAKVASELEQCLALLRQP
jgi:DNA-binding transcriptional MerR regulator